MKTCSICAEIKAPDGFPARGLICRRCKSRLTLQLVARNPAYAERQKMRRLSREVKDQAAARYREVSNERTLMAGAKQRARVKGLTLEISEKDIDIPTNCPCCGVKLVRGRDRLHAASPSLDRVDNRFGYIPANVWVICFRCNGIKKDSTHMELFNIAAAVERRLLDAN